MNYTFSAQTVVFVALLAVVLPAVFRIVSNPFTLLLVSPFVLALLGIAFLVLNVLVSHLLDAKAPSARNNLRHAARPFVFSSPAAWQAVLTRSQWSHNSPQSFPPLVPNAPVLSGAINDILIMIVRDFVLVWYKDISTSPSFPMAVSGVLHKSLENILDRAAGIDLAELVVKRILPKVTAHVEQFRQSEVALRGAGLERRLTQSEELDLLLASRYTSKGGGKLHPSVDNLSTTFTRQTEEAHLRQLVAKALPFILPETEGQSRVLKLVVREIVACAVLYPVMEMLSDPDFWNKAIDQVAGAAIHEQKLITKVRNVLEAQSPRPHHRLSSAPVPAGPTTETITIKTDARQFESFLRSINRFSSLLDARRLKNDVVGEIRRTRILLANHEKEDWINGDKTEDVVAFLDRLYTAKRKVEERIVVLGGGDDSGRQSSFHEPGVKSGVTLREVLQNPSSLSYFMEFMDRRQRSLLVQFWLTVESFKNPLESVDSSSSGDEDDPIQDASTLVTVREDISMIYELYFSTPTPHPTLASIPKKHIQRIRDFATSDQPPSPATQRTVRRSVMLAQRQVERNMEHDFEDFERSELWFRAIGDTEFGRSAQRNSPEPAPSLKYRRSVTSPGLANLHLTGVPSPLKQSYGPLPHMLPRSETSPGYVRQRSASGGSHRSSGSHSHQSRPSNIEVLMSPVFDTSSDDSRAPLFDDPDDRLQRAEEVRMEAIQAALTDIMALQQTPNDEDLGDRDTMFAPSHSRKGSGKRRAMFDVDEVDEIDEDRQEEAGEETGSFQMAAPGDLQLSYDIARLGDNIANLQSQEAILVTLIKKAELTGDTQELKLLNKSKSAMNRELRALQFQKSQYEQQDAVNRLFSDRTKVAIVSSTVGDEEGKQVVRYLVEIQQLAPDGSFASGWVVARRYNEFLTMHTKLRDKYALVRNLDFPGKRLVTALSNSFVDTRKVALEKYLQNLIAIPIVCDSDELRGFLSRESPFSASETPGAAAKGPAAFSGTDLVRNVYKSVTESIDDMFFGPSMLDVMIQRLTRQAAEFAGIVGSGVNDVDLVAQALNASGKTSSEAAMMELSGDLKPLEGETSTSTFSAPICDLLLAVFELNKTNNWLRRQAVVIILQQVLGGTIERKIREQVKAFLEESRIMVIVNLFRNGLWPGGKLKPPSVPRTPDEKLKTRDDANRKLSSLVPDLAANMIGRTNARRGARRIFAVLQNRRLNQHIAYTIVDEVFAALFPDAS
ncbi:PhoX domain-containing protein [Mycena albidolilacea]|uniref:PhoX domain-containing protein n=1 Tax=Mycena albidolilacea TaxID=1033008 RepID=A0AAD7AKI4_9AGAR|nr:PhoX domain-containing protein [Mycena albidolilacea]